MCEADLRVRAFDRLQVTHGTVHQVLRRNPLFAGYTHHRNHAAVYLLPPRERIVSSFSARTVSGGYANKGIVRFSNISWYENDISQGVMTSPVEISIFKGILVLSRYASSESRTPWYSESSIISSVFLITKLILSSISTSAICQTICSALSQFKGSCAGWCQCPSSHGCRSRPLRKSTYHPLK